MSEHIIHTTDDGFESDVLQADMPVLVDYWAEVWTLQNDCPHSERDCG